MNMNMNMNTDFNTNNLLVNQTVALAPDTSNKIKKESKNFEEILKSEKSNVSKLEKNSPSSCNDNKITAKDEKNSGAIKDNSSNELEVKDLNVELEKIIENMSTDDILSYLSTIANLLNNPGDKNDLVVSIDLKNSIANALMSASKEEIGIGNLNSENSISNLVNASGDDISSILNNLLTALKDENTIDALDSDSLSTVNSLLKELGVRIEENPSIVKSGESDFVQQLVKDIEGEVKTLIGHKSKEGNLDDNTKNDVLLNESAKVDKNATKVESTSKGNTSEKNQDQSSYKPNEELDKTVAKEEKVLSSILGEESDTKVSKFSLFADRMTTSRVDAPVEPQVVNKATMVQDVVKSVKYMVNNSVKELTVRMNPKDLGEIAIKIVQEDGIMKASIKASSKDTYSILSQNLNDIKKYLGEQNIKIQEVNIGLYNEDTTFFKDEEFANNFFNEGRDDSNKNKNNNSRVVTSEELSEDAEVEDLSNINMLA